MDDSTDEERTGLIVARSVQQGLLSAVTPGLRCVQGRVDGTAVWLRAVYGCPPTEIDLEDMSEVETEVMASFDDSVSVRMEVVHVPDGTPYRAVGWTTYFQRKEVARED